MKISYSKPLSFLFLLITINSTFSQTQTCTNCGVGESNPDAKLEVKGCGNTDATKSLQITNSDEKESLVVTDAGKVGIGTNSPDYPLDVTGDANVEGQLSIKKGYSIDENYSEAVLHIPNFTNGISNESVRINLGNIKMWGSLQIDVTGGFGYQNTTGWVKKKWAAGMNLGGLIYTNSVEVQESFGMISSQITIGDIAWDPGISEYYITIYHIVSTSNHYSIKIKYHSSTNNSSVIKSFSLGSIESVAIPTEYQTPQANLYINGKVGIGTKTPKYPLSVAGKINAEENGDYYGGWFGGEARTGKPSVNVGSWYNNKGGMTYDSQNQKLNIGTESGSGNYMETMTLKDGNVGIGTLTPEATLHIIGSGIRSERFSMGGIYDRINEAPWYGMGRSDVTNLSSTNNAVAMQVAGFYGLKLKTSNGEINLHQNGNVGIGVITPTRKLDVDGDVFIKDQVGIGTYFIPENQLSVASNTAEWLGYFRQGGSNGAQSNGVKIDVYNDNGLSEVLKVRSHGTGGWKNLIIANAIGKVGFGTAYPQETAHVKGTFQIETPAASTVGQVWTSTSTDGKGEWADATQVANSSKLTLDQNGAMGDPFLHLIPDSGEPDSWMIGVDDSGNKLSFAKGLSHNNIAFGTSADKMTLDNKGYLGLGTISPSAQLHVIGTNGVIKAEHSGNNRVISINAGNSMIEATSNLNLNRNSSTHVTLANGGGNVGIGTLTPGYQLHVLGHANVAFEHTGGRRMLLSPANGMIEMKNASLYLNRNESTNVILAYGGGKVGIGTQTPTYKFDLRSDLVGTIFNTSSLDGSDGFTINRVSGTKMTAVLKKSTADVEFRAERTTSSGSTAVLKAANNSTFVGSESPDPLNIVTNNQSRINIESGGKVKITELLNLPVSTTKPTTNLAIGDLVIIDNNGNAEMWVYLSSGWSQINH